MNNFILQLRFSSCKSAGIYATEPRSKEHVYLPFIGGGRFKIFSGHQCQKLVYTQVLQRIIYVLVRNVSFAFKFDSVCFRVAIIIVSRTLYILCCIGLARLVKKHTLRVLMSVVTFSSLRVSIIIVHIYRQDRYIHACMHLLTHIHIQRQEVFI